MIRVSTSRAVLAGCCTLALAACGGGGGNSGGNSGGASSPEPSGSGAAAASTIHVIADPNTVGAFSPKTATAHVGDTVKWTFDDPSNSHTVTSDSGDPDSFDSGTQGQGQTFTFTFTKAGTYAYHCSLHSGMTGTITVS